MTNISNLAKIEGIITDDWFIPNMIRSIELDNSFVLWSTVESEYYLDSVNNLLKIKYFDRQRVTFPLNIELVDGIIKLTPNNKGYYYKGKDMKDFKLPKIEDKLLMGNQTFEIETIKKHNEDYIIKVTDQETFILNFNNQVDLLVKTNKQLYTENNIRYIKNYRSNNLADVYINGEDIHSVAAVYY